MRWNVIRYGRSTGSNHSASASRPTRPSPVVTSSTKSDTSVATSRLSSASAYWDASWRIASVASSRSSRLRRSTSRPSRSSGMPLSCTAMEVDVYLGPRPDGAGDRARAFEELGVDGIFTAEAAHGPFLPLVLAAEHTRRVTLLTNIVVAFARSPMDLAVTANDLQAMSRGRFVLGIGTQIRPHIEHRYSMRWSGSPVGQVRDLVQAIRAIQT